MGQLYPLLISYIWIKLYKVTFSLWQRLSITCMPLENSNLLQLLIWTWSNMPLDWINEDINYAQFKYSRVNTSIIVYLWEFLLIWMCYNRNLLNWFRTFYMFMYTHMTCYLSATIYLKPHGYPRPFNTALEKVLNTVQCSSIQVRLWFC